MPKVMWIVFQNSAGQFLFCKFFEHQTEGTAVPRAAQKKAEPSAGRGFRLLLLTLWDGCEYKSGFPEYRVSCSQAHSPARPALRGFTFVQDFSSSPASSPHGLAAHAVAFDSWLPSEGPTRVFHPLAHHHAQRTCARLATLAFAPPHPGGVKAGEGKTNYRKHYAPTFLRRGWPNNWRWGDLQIQHAVRRHHQFPCP